MAKVKRYLSKEGFQKITPNTHCYIECVSDTYVLVVKHNNENKLAFRWDDTCFTDELFTYNHENNVYKSVSDVINHILDLATKELGLAYDEVTITIFGGQPSSENTKQAMEFYKKVASVANKKIEFGNGFHEMGDDETQDIIVSRDDIAVTQEPAYQSNDDSVLSSDYSGNSSTDYSETSAPVPYSTDTPASPVVFSAPSAASPPQSRPDTSDDESDTPAAAPASASFAPRRSLRLQGRQPN